ncbi:MAG: response regulator [Brevundimonas sp.]|nr:response regulator [Brevundimonas sp.]
MPLNSSVSVVEDDDSLRIAIVGLLDSLGYRVKAYSSAETFLDDPSGHEADCIITDIQMPGLNGIELKQRLDRLGVRTPVIMVTARTDASLHARAQASGAICVLQKPFQERDLVRCIESALPA